MLERACGSMAGALQQQSEPLVGGVDRQGLLMVQLFVCYKLSGWTVDKSIEVWYVGYVRVLAHQALQQAVDWRKGNICKLSNGASEMWAPALCRQCHYRARKKMEPISANPESLYFHYSLLASQLLHLGSSSNSSSGVGSTVALQF